MTEPTVEISQGKLKGILFYDMKGGVNSAFLGIPYAKPPINELRFKPPEFPDPWIGTRDATEEGSACKSRHSEKNIIHGSEDCLFINVYTPQVTNTPYKFQQSTSNKSAGYPVMVFIHGGGFHMGSSSNKSFGPDYLLTEKIVFVSFNYRLGVFGFLSLKDESLSVPGNAGLKDQLMALTWVQQNISAFGGDPNNVTVFGHSAGSASVHYLLLSERSKGLFQRAILQSGTAFNVWARGESLSEISKKHLGFHGEDDATILKKLLSKTTDELFELQEKIIPLQTEGYNRPWVPVVEPPSSGAIISDNPMNIIKSGKYNMVPMIVGYSDREGIFSKIINLLLNNNSNEISFEEEICNHFAVKRNSKECKLVAEDFRSFYIGEEDQTNENLDKIYSLQTDTIFFRGIHQAFRAHLSTNPNPMYLYRFSFDGRLNFLKKFIYKLKDMGACHGDDLGYLFKMEWTPSIIPNSSEEFVLKCMVKLWTNFAKYGDPNKNQQKELIKIQWNPAVENKLNYLEIGENLTVGVDPDQYRMDFFNKVEQKIKPRYLL